MEQRFTKNIIGHIVNMRIPDTEADNLLSSEYITDLMCKVNPDRSISIVAPRLEGELHRYIKKGYTVMNKPEIDVTFPHFLIITRNGEVTLSILAKGTTLPTPEHVNDCLTIDIVATDKTINVKAYDYEYCEKACAYVKIN